MSRRGLLRSLDRCCLGLVALLVAGSAAGVLPAVSLSCPLPLRRTHPPAVVCCFRVFAEVGVTNTISGRLEVNLSLSEKRDGKSHLRTTLLLAVSDTGDVAWSSNRCCLYPWKQRMTMRNHQIPETAESRIVPKWLYPPRFSDKDRFTSSRPDFVLLTPIAAKTQNNKLM